MGRNVQIKHVFLDRNYNFTIEIIQFSISIYVLVSFDPTSMVHTVMCYGVDKTSIELKVVLREHQTSSLQYCKRNYNDFES